MKRLWSKEHRADGVKKIAKILAFNIMRKIF